MFRFGNRAVRTVVTVAKNHGMQRGGDAMTNWLIVFSLTAGIFASQAGTQETVKLPPPRVKGTMSLEETLAKRESVRELKAPPLSWEEIGQLLWAAQGITHGDGLRTAPSAGARYPLELYVSTPAGVYRYDPRRHEVARVLSRDARGDIRRAALNQGALDAPSIFIVTAYVERTARYGERATRYVHIEAGHAAQNLLLQATASGLAAVPVGAFDDQKVHDVLTLPPDCRVVYLIPVGRK